MTQTHTGKALTLLFIGCVLQCFSIVILLNVLIAVVTESYQQSFIERSKLFGKVRVPLLARQEFLEEVFRSNKSNPRRWFYLMVYLLLMLALESSFIHFIILMTSKNKLREKMITMKTSYIFVLLLGSFFIFAANVVMIMDLVDKCELQSCFSISRKFKIFKNVHHWLAIGMRSLSQRLFGIKRCNAVEDVENSEDYDGWINYVLSQTKEAIQISEDNILSDIRSLESRLEEKGLLT